MLKFKTKYTLNKKKILFRWHSDGRIVFDENTQAYVDFLAVVASTVKAILPRLKDFHNILVNPPLVSCFIYVLRTRVSRKKYNGKNVLYCH